MPISFHKGALALAAFTTAISASSAMAETQQVMILDEVFFPAIVYVQPGEQLMFTNDSDRERTVRGADESWTSGPLPFGASFTYTVDTNSPLVFKSLFKTADEESSVSFEGTISFNAPPLSE